MEKHVENYFKGMGYKPGDFIACELCGAPSSDIHHVIPRSKFGSKRKKEQDAISNLAALCRSCHNKAHGYLANTIKGQLQEIIEHRSKLF